MAGTKKGLAIREVIGVCERLAPLHLAAEWDNTGLIVGNPDDAATGIVVALDVTGDVIDLAVRAGANLIITHHPLIFSPLRKVDTSTPAGALLKRLLKHDIANYSMHTNLDSAPRGLNDHVARIIGLKGIRPLQMGGISCRTGSLPKPVSSRSFASDVRKALKVGSVRHFGPERKVRRVAVATGSGGDLLLEAARAGVDCLVTGDVRHHTAMESAAAGFPVIDAGHCGTERPMAGLVSAFLKKNLTKGGKSIRIIPFDMDEPFETL